MSRESYPKQYLKCNPLSNYSFLQETQIRIKNIKDLQPPIVICNVDHRFIVAEQLREINIAKNLLLEGAFLAIHDPKVQLEQISNDLKSYSFDEVKDNRNSKNKESNWSLYSDLYEAAIDSHALIILTEWENYKKIDWKKISKKMKKPSWVFDTRGILEKDKIKETGINFWQLGDGSLQN